MNDEALCPETGWVVVFESDNVLDPVMIFPFESVRRFVVVTLLFNVKAPPLVRDRLQNDVAPVRAWLPAEEKFTELVCALKVAELVQSPCKE